jgi:vancomycin resistance protein YoaR
MSTKTLLTLPPGGPSAGRRVGFPPRILIMATALALMLLAGGGVWFAQAQESARRMAQGVQVAGLPVAGMTAQEAQAAIVAHFGDVPDSQIVTQAAGKTWTFKARDLGIGLDAAATADAAHRAGRDASNVLDTPLVFTRDRAAAEATLAVAAADLAIQPVDAAFSVDADGVRVTPAQAGRRFDMEATWAAVVAATQTYPFGEVTAQTVVVPPRLTDADIAPALATIHQLSDQPLALTGTGPDGKPRAWSVGPDRLRTWLVINQPAGAAPTAQSSLDAAKLTSYLQSLAPDLKRDPQDATLALPNYATATVLTPDVAGQELNVAASLPRLQAAAQAQGAGRATDLVLDSIPAQTQAAALAPLRDQMNATMRAGLTLTYGDKTYQVKGASLALTMYLQPAPAGAAIPYQLTVNDDDLARMVSVIAGRVDTVPQNAMYRLVSGAVTLAKQPRDGLKVDQAQTAAAIKAAVLAGDKQAVMTTAPVKPDFAATDQAGTIVTPDLLQADNTDYSTSSPERNWNVTFGASKLDGWLIAPGSTFSVNDALGDLTLQAGFKMGWAILVQSGDATTIPSEAGGICQVVTTLFHPVFWAGLPMVERHHHSYWIASYGRPPLGMQGLDATISPPDSDFRFKNTTGNWLMIRAVGDHKNLHVELWGTNPGWRVDVSQPVITNIVKTDQARRNETSNKLAAGRQVMVEHAQDGFTSDIHRQVFDRNGVKIDDWHAQGTYLPSHNTYVTGTGPAAP